jgi:hypothetical protein
MSTTKYTTTRGPSVVTTVMVVFLIVIVTFLTFLRVIAIAFACVRYDVQNVDSEEGVPPAWLAAVY